MNKCSICGKEVDKFYTDNVCSEQCFEEKYWRNKEIQYLDGVKYIIINGKMYIDGGRKPSYYSSYLGHDGKEFNIMMDDGTKISTNNLWYNGVITENHKDILCDNAVFID